MYQHGAAVAPASRPWRNGFAWLAESAAAAVLAYLLHQYFIYLAASIFIILRGRAHILKLKGNAAGIRLIPAASGGFAILQKGIVKIPFDRASFDVAHWAAGRAVVTDGTLNISIPLDAGRGAFLLFAALARAIGTPDDRLVD